MYGATTSRIGPWRNCITEAQRSSPNFNWDRTNLVWLSKAFRQHAECMFKGPLVQKNEEKKKPAKDVEVTELSSVILKGWPNSREMCLHL